jgi:hypothetical protein
LNESIFGPQVRQPKTFKRLAEISESLRSGATPTDPRYRVSALRQLTVTVIGNADAPLPVLIKKRWPSRVEWYWLPLALTGKSSFGMPGVKRSTAPLTSTAINRPSGTVAPKGSVDAVAM